MRTGPNHTKEAWSMSQEILFFLFMVGELVLIVTLYTYWIIPKVSLATNTLFEKRMLDKTWDIPAMLEDYTEHLAVVFSEIIKTLVPQVVGGFMSEGNRQLRADPENLLANTTADYLDSLDPPARMVANMLLPRLKEALSKSTNDGTVQVKYEPGIK